LEEVEVALVETCIEMGKIQQPLSCTEAITLMNDMIKNTNTKQKLIKCQQSRRLGTYGFEKGKVTSGWWRGFLRRNEDKLVTKRGENFALNRHNWTTLSNIDCRNGLLVHLLLRPQIKVTMRTMMLLARYIGFTTKPLHV